MTWKIKDHYCYHEYLTVQKIPHLITTKKSGNMLDANKRKELFQKLTKEKYFNINWNDFPFAQCRQVHSSNISEVKNIQKDSIVSNCDGLFSFQKNIIQGIFTADCLPVFVVNKNREFIALLHVGWKGTQQEILHKFLDSIDSKVNKADIVFVFGPHIKSCCYKVGKEFRKYFEVQERQDKYFLDLESENVNQLINFGISKKNIHASQICTKCDDRFFSYRSGDKNNRIGSFIINH
ncbi:polyphenol oxidase family protein [bacterium]